MKHRKLRIAWSVAWGIACLLLAAQWVRSYWWADCITTDVLGNGRVTIWLLPGVITIRPVDYSNIRMMTLSVPQTVWTDDLLGEHDSPVWGAFAYINGWVQVPYWFLIFLTAAISAIPWLRWRFSLRTLLIGMTVAAIGLGWLVYAVRK